MPKKLTTDSFITRANLIHNNKYDYSLVNYIKSNIKVIIICPIHGQFEQRPDAHLKGHACCLCGNALKEKRKINDISIYIEKSKQLYGNKFDYSESIYLGKNTPVKIKCNDCNDIFYQRMYDNVNNGCANCNKSKHLDTNSFIIRSKFIHKDKYDYSKTNYINTHTVVIITCKIHGDFLQTPGSHLNGAGCRKCFYDTKTIKQDDFIKSCIKTHGNKYDYSQTIYINNNFDIDIICPFHGIFKQNPRYHKNGSGCPNCYKEQYRMTTEKLILNCIKTHGNRYDYSQTIYVNSKTKIIVICKIHGPFFQLPYNHSNGCNCPKCNKISKGEMEIMNFFKNNNVEYVWQKLFNDCKNPKTNRKLIYDFYIPSRNILIEFDGKQHFNCSFIREHFIAQNELDDIKYKDEVKNKYALENNIKLIRIPYTKIKQINEILLNELKLSGDYINC